MKGKLNAAAVILRPVMDTYMDSALAIVGCCSKGIARYSCEYDVLVVGGEKRPSTSLKIGDDYVDIEFATEKEALKPTNPERAISLAFAKPIKDTSLVISTATAASSATLSESATKASRTRLASALKAIGRAEVALATKTTIDADLWLLASAYEFAYASLLSREVLPSPSHLLSQLRSAKGAPKTFEGVSMGGGLEAAGRAGCGARLEGVVVLHDLLREGSKSEPAQPEWPSVRTETVAAKAGELVTRIELAECYSFLGQELVGALLELLRLHPKATLATLTSGKDRLLGERLVRQLGLVRTEEGIRAGLEALKGQVNLLAKRA
ncbi:MAG: hypothetical protein JRN06_02710 [Nitrososphaerota archaeon]|nr:hypothetical protein [Nitrososphaerota archaeon]MDG7023232.1 hypothetical protein [Nitrososphaerota archaeon]